MYTNLTIGGGGAVLWGVKCCSPSLESVGSSTERDCLGLRPGGLPCPGPVRSPVDFLVFGFFADWRMASSKEGGSWYGGRVLKSLCGPLAGYAEFISSSPVLCARRPFLANREPGLRSLSGCRTESEGRRKLLLLYGFWSSTVNAHLRSRIDGRCVDWTWVWWIEEILSTNYSFISRSVLKEF